jgi:serine/threonine protein kinase
MRPGVQCKKSYHTDNGTISKLFADKRDADDEIVMHNKIVNKIDPEGAFTIKLIDNCPVTNLSFKLNELEKCGNFNDAEKESEYFHQIVYEYGGYDLNACTRKFRFEDLFRAMSGIFKGLIAMEKHGYIHVDIKPANIVYNPENKKTALIDFGLAMKSSGLYVEENNNIFSHPYPYYPPEFKAIEFYFYYSHSKDDLWKYEYIIENRELDIIPKSDKEMAQFYSFLESAKHLDKELPLNKIDVYMLGVTLHEVFHKCKKSTENNSFNAAVINLCDKMTHYDPRVRLSPTEAYAEYKNVLAMIEPVSPEPASDKRVAKPASATKPAKPASLRVAKPNNKDCPEGKIRNPKTGRCIKVAKSTPATKPASLRVAKPNNKDCPEGKIRNPKTGRCIKSKEPTKPVSPVAKPASLRVAKPKNKDCPEGKIRNPKTGRCIKSKEPTKPASPEGRVAKPKNKDCPEGKIRNPKTGRCIKDKELKPAPKDKKPASPENKDCPEGKVRNPKTGRCIKECPEDRNPKTGRCVKKCRDGKVRNPKTGHCIKVRE